MSIALPSKGPVTHRSLTTPVPAPATRRDVSTGHAGRALFVVLFLATLLNGLDASEFTSASTVIARELHLGIGAIGLLASAFTVCLTISIIPVGLWADRARRTHIIALCLAVWSLATALTGLAGGFVALLATRMLTGVGEAGYLPAGNSLVGDAFATAKRGKVMSWLLVGGVAGPILGMVLGGVLAGLGTGTWRLAFFVTGIPGLILAAFAWRLREPSRRQAGGDAEPIAVPAGATQPREVALHLGTFLHNPVLLCLIGIGVLTAFTSAALQTYFPTLLQQHDTFGLTSAQAGTFAALVLGPTGLIGVVLGGYLADWLRRRHPRANLQLTTVSVLLVAPLNALSLVVMTTHHIVPFAAVMVVTFLINTLHFGPLAAAVLDAVPSDQCASAVAVSVFIQRILGTALAPLLIGLLAQQFDPTGLHLAQGIAGHDLIMALICTCPVAFIGAGILGIVALRRMGHDRAIRRSSVVG